MPRKDLPESNPKKGFFGRIKNSSWKVRIFALILLAIIGFVIYRSFFHTNTNGYTYEEVERRDISETVSESGNIMTKGMTDIHSPTKGIIEEVYVKNGDIVGIDQELFKVQSTATEDEKAAAEASVLAAQSSLKTAQQSKKTLEASLEAARKTVIDARTTVHQRNDRLIRGEDNPATGKEYTEAEIDSIDATLNSALRSYEAIEKQYVESGTSIAAASAALESAKLQMDSTESRTVLSPAIGTVANLSVSPGDSVAVMTTLVTPNPVMTIANFSTDSVSIDVNESDISKLKVDQTAQIEVDALDIVYDGVITRIDDVGVTSGNGGVVKYTVYVDFTNKDDKLKSGMSVDVDIKTEEKENVLTVSNSALKPYQGGRAVRVLNETTGEIEYIPVEVGVRGKNYTEIISGLNEGQMIIAADQGKKKSGGLGF